MNRQKMIDRILDLEWKMFHNVNGDTRAFCQQDRQTFEIMRRAQYEAWSDETVAAFLEDIEAADAEGRNLSREKYIHMMKTTDPKGYETFRDELPEPDPVREALVGRLWKKYCAQTERMREKYPILALGGRPLYASDALEDDTSIETYQTGEMMTYSVKTLRALLAHMETLEAAGTDLAFEIQCNTVKGLGYPSMEAAEQAMAKQLEQMQSRGCCGQ